MIAMLRHVWGGIKLPLPAVLLTFALLCVAHSGARADEQAAHGVQFHQEGHGWLLRDGKGMTLYVFARDEQPGKSACGKLCIVTWPPYAASSEDKADGDLSIITRDDDTRQWAFRGKPLYYYVRDVSPGDENGDGAVNGAWSIAFKEIPKPAGVSIAKTMKGWILADGKGMTLYVSDSDAPKKTPSCNADCMTKWRPLHAPQLATSDGDWSVVTRADGTKQWAYKDKPLYTYAGDFVAGDTLGDGAARGWRVLVLDPPKPVPAWLTVQSTDDADVYGDRAGMTIYVHDIAHSRRVVGPAKASDDDDGPMRRPQDWKPVLATADDKAVGDWTIVTRTNGNRQWAYKGLLAYTNVNDNKPGELNGVRRDDLTWRVIPLTGGNLNGTGA
jgi:predicted lipoprotein with Yx(FWY)xxD motif